MTVAHALTEATLDDATTGVELIAAVNDDSTRVTGDAADDTVAFYDTASARGVTGFCQLDQRKTFFSLIERLPSLGQQAHVTTSHSTNARVLSTR